jgi:type IV pilus assembly protein PilQ
MELNFLSNFCRRLFWGATIALFLVSPSFSQESPASESLAIKKIEVIESTDGPRVSIEGSKPFEYTVFKLANPLRIVVDLPGASLGKLAGPIKVQNGIVNAIQNKQMGEAARRKARVEIGLDRSVDYDVISEGNFLFIALGGKPTAASSASPKPKEVQREVKKESPQPEAPLQGAKAVVDVAVTDRKDWLEVEIKGDGALPNYRSFKLSRPSRLVVDLPRISNAFSKKQINVGSPFLKDIRIGQTPERLRFVLNSPGEKLPPYELSKEGQNLLIVLGRVKDKEEVKKESAQVAETPKVIPAAEAEAKKAVEQKEAATPGSEAPKPALAAKTEMAKAAEPVAEAPKTEMKEASPPPAPPIVASVEAKETPEKAPAAQSKKARISLDFKDADLHNIFRLIAEVSDLNIITTDDVKGKVTIRMVNVPWDQALDVILSTKGLVKIEEGNVLRITTLDNIRKEREAKQKEEDDLIKARESREKLEELTTETISVNYTKAADLQKLIREKDEKGKGFLSPRGSVKADERTNTLIIQDGKQQIDEIKNLIKKLDAPTPQVLIEARIVQAVTTFARALGVQWGGSYNQTAASGWAWGLTGNNPTAAPGWGFNSGTGTNLNMPSNFVVNFPPTSGFTPFGGAAISFGKLTGSLVNLDLRLQMGETDGQTKVIARPKLATLTNREAVIKQGEKIPYETTSQAGTQVQFIDAVLSLRVTPQVTPDGTIMMKVAVTRDARGNFRSPLLQVPSIDNREASTEVLVKDGDTIVIGGIYESENTESQQGIPWLMKIPVLGWLFKNQEVQNIKRELLIFITPTLMSAKAEL